MVEGSWFRRLLASLLRPLGYYLPTWLRCLLGAAFALPLLMTLLGASIAHYQGYSGLPSTDDLDVMCRAGKLPALRTGGYDRCFCGSQLRQRDQQIADTNEDLAIACQRRRFFREGLRNNVADARRVLREETAEIKASFARLRELRGPTMGDALWLTLLLMAFSMATMIGANYLAAFHAAGAEFRRALEPEIRKPFLRAFAINTVVATGVLVVESLDPHKSAFGWDSHCVNQVVSWIDHGAMVPVALVFSVSLALGWYFSATKHVPGVNAEMPRWGVGRYVSFLETWSSVIVALAGVLMAVWIHALAATPSRTNVILLFLGSGALLGGVGLVLRFVYCAVLVRRAIRAVIEASPGRHEWPTDPTDGILGERWWKLPTAFAVSGGLAYQLLESAGISKLFHAGP